MAKRPTALKGFISQLWAVDEQWANFARQLLTTGERAEIPERRDDEDFALLSRAGARPENTRYVFTTGNRAVIDVYGAIIPRANFLSEWSGGVSCELLAKDVEWAVASEEIEEILLVIHSPGGEVTGVSELAESIYRAREKKKITAYVSGMGCSAAYWIASACSEIVCADTAILGSIGAMSVYVDDTKRLEMIGLEEIEFISSQSPLKNADPKTPKGKKAIQERVDAIAGVFIETVARNRGRDVSTVLADFGQGGVFVGADAVNAGLADRLGSFAALNTDTGFTEEFSTLAVDQSKKEKNMADKDKQPQAGGDEAKTITVDAAEFEQMKQQIADLASGKATSEELVAQLKAEKLQTELTAIARKFEGETAKHVTVLTALEAAGGKDSEPFKAYVELQSALSKQIEASSLFDAQGSDKGGEPKSPMEELDAIARDLVKTNKITFAEAFAQAASDNPEIYDRYNAERQKAKGE